MEGGKTQSSAQMLLMCLALVIFSVWLVPARASSDHPIKFRNEEEFFKAKTHERSMTVKEMEQKIKVIRERRKFTPWDISNPTVAKALADFQPSHTEHNSTKLHKRPNILFILADDLGYGDLSVHPFSKDPDGRWPCGEGGMRSPNLERMASQGITLTNFHSAAPVCSPARAAVMTGLYSWRMTAMNAFELGSSLITTFAPRDSASQ